MAYATKTACLRALLNALSSPRVAMSQVNADLAGTNIGGWGDAGSYVGEGDAIVSTGDPVMTAKLPDATKYPAFADSAALIAAAAVANSRETITNVILRLCNTQP